MIKQIFTNDTLCISSELVALLKIIQTKTLLTCEVSTVLGSLKTLSGMGISQSGIFLLELQASPNSNLQTASGAGENTIYKTSEMVISKKRFYFYKHCHNIQFV